MRGSWVAVAACAAGACAEWASSRLGGASLSIVPVLAAVRP